MGELEELRPGGQCLEVVVRGTVPLSHGPQVAPSFLPVSR